MAKDEEFIENVSELARAGKKKAGELMGEFTDNAEHSEELLIEKLMQKAHQAKEELEKKVEEIAGSVYSKMHIAHTDETNRLSKEIEQLKTELMQAEARIVYLEGQAK